VNRTLLIAPLLVFGLSGILLLWWFLDSGSGPFHDSLLPELIGFCLEGFFLVGLFTFVQQLREHERRRELWLSLRGSLRVFLSHLDIAFLEEDAEPMSSSELEDDPVVVKTLLSKLKTQDMSLESMSAFKTLARRDLALTHDLIPVAAQLSAGHMRWWLAIMDSMRQLSEANTRADLEYALEMFLIHLQEFDQLKL
jgi:hypothetical protein